MIIETKFLDDESYHGDFEDNDSLEGETLEDIIQNLEDKLQIVLYRLEKSNDLNLIEEKLKLV